MFLRSEVKSILILTLFSYLMWDYLTIATIGFSSLGFVLVGMRIKVPWLLRNIIALAVFGSYWIKYGKVIDPEIGLNFLTSVVVMKLLEKDSLRDSYMIFFGLILLLSAGALFEKSLTYVFFFTSSFAILLYDFYGTLLIKSRTKDLFVGLLWVVPLTCIMFFAVPRMMSPLPFKAGTSSSGEVGYSPNVRISEVESLELNDEPAFQALVDAQLPAEKLYWRGNVLGQTDGWNWSTSHADNLVFPATKVIPEITPGEIRQKMRLFGKEDYYFALDHAEKFYFGGRTISPDDLRSHDQLTDDWNPRYEVVSRIDDGIPREEEASQKYFKVILNKKLREWVDVTFPSTDIAGLRQDIQNYYQKEGFTYSLKPGKVLSFREFMEEKKTGFCSHYASATAIILRARGIPTRLVSGFMGGNFNPYARFYLVTQNDAHVWIEALENGKWTRMDPTAWIVPDRVTLGGEAFLATAAAGAGGTASAFARRFNFKWFRDASLWFNQWDFKFYQWLEEMDYYGQEAFLTRLNFKRKWLYTFAPFVILFFVLIYLWQMKRLERNLGLTLQDSIWKEFVTKVRGKGLELVPVSVKEMERQITGWKHPDRSRVEDLWKKLVSLSFGSEARQTWQTLRKEIKKL